ncbi:MAG: LysM peptidoglycan-binding domain-containing protein [Lachnospiraceae bacterium]|nr:LysM peptidoglycan-binding domain-containing protein [Lachnospiraceae bacterium]
MYCARTITHTVKPGDTIYRIAKMHRTNVPDILMRNPGINPYNLQIGSTIEVCVEETNEPPKRLADEMELNQDFRMAWTQLAYWTRMYVDAVTEDAGNQGEIRSRLEQIPAAMADIFGRFYPADMTAGLQQELMTFTDRLSELVLLVKEGKTEQTDELETQLEEQVKTIAAMLSNLNVNYDSKELEEVLGEYLMLTKRGVVARLAGEYADDIATFDALEQQAVKIADYLSEGIAGQSYYMQKNA